MQPSTSSLRRVRPRVWTVLLLAGLALLSVQRSGVPTAHASAAVPSLGVEPFDTDVYRIGGNGTLIHVDLRTTPTTTPLFNIAGEPLGLTLGTWIATGAQATAHETGGTRHPETTVHVHLTGLIPGGVYSLFYSTFGPASNNPLCPTVEPTLPLTSANPHQKPDAASFTADAHGRASFTGRVAGHLLDAQSVTYSVIYHFDGQTYGALANLGESVSQPVSPGHPCRSSYGADAMRQLLIIQK